ncbi:hypothetical protein AAFC00_002099 [Neodothiora populina]|uniref:Mannose-6-phosphate isomerase n=1 Tax=Neodothiora populina TaxID=2781224 RepID=A0ABR3PGA6_9PEZI
MVDPVLQIKASCNQYPWGKTGRDSLAAALCEKTPGWGGKGPNEDFKLDESKPYAEMWFGTYPVLPSYTMDGQDLQDVIDKNAEEMVGKNVIDKFGHAKLPYLPKVLSIAKALPLQLHPNKDLASKLHEKDPENFTDPNHKPEIAIALTKFEAFCGFKPVDTISKLMQLEPLKQYLPDASSTKFDDQTLKHVVKQMLTAEDATIGKTVDALHKTDKSSFGSDTYIPDMIPRLADQYDKTDPGLVVALITMNYLVLQPGESIYIPADGIHAYLSGDIIECMARSNNVLNTGFCPSAERNSADLFCSCLTFTPHTAEDCMLPAKPYKGSKSGKTLVYKPPMSEFNMTRTQLDKTDSETLAAVSGPSTAIATKGEAIIKAKGKQWTIKEGNIFFISQGTEVELVAKDGLEMFTAYVE